MARGRRAPQPSLDVLLRTAFQAAIPENSDRPTFTALGKMLGVSRSTAARWYRGEGKPAPATLKRVQPVLNKTYKRVKTAIDKQNAAIGARPPKQAIPVLGTRQLIKQRKYGKETGKLVPADWVNYDMRGLDLRAMFDFLRGLRDTGPHQIQLIYDVLPGTRSLYGLINDSYTIKHESTAVIRLSRRMSDQALWEDTLAPFAEVHINWSNITYIGVADKK